MTELLDRLGKAEETWGLGYNAGCQHGFKEGFALAAERIQKALNEPLPEPYKMDVWPGRGDLPGYPEF